MRIFQLSIELAELILLLTELGENSQQLLVLALDFIEGIGGGTVGPARSQCFSCGPHPSGELIAGMPCRPRRGFLPGRW